MRLPPAAGPYEVPEQYQQDARARAFWRVSFRCARGYLSAKDTSGQAILIPHEREEADSYARRLRFTRPRNFVGPTLRRYNAIVFRKAPVRDAQAAPVYAEFVANATEAGMGLDAFVSEALLRAMVDREAYILPEVEGDAPAAPTVAAVRAAGTRPVVCLIDADAVLEVETEEGGQVLCEALVRMTRDDNVKVLRYYTEETYTDYVLAPVQPAAGAVLTIDRVEPPVAHGYGQCPLVRLRPCVDPFGTLPGAGAGDSVAGPLAESQMAINNLLSLLNEEICNVTFSQMLVMGVSADQFKDQKVGTTRLLCVPNPQGSVEVLGADPAQAVSIRDSIADEVANLLRLAGLGSAETLTAPQSGLALAFRYNDLATIVSALAVAAEDAEDCLARVLASGWGFEAPPRPQYQGKDPELPDYPGETTTLLAVLTASGIPAVLREKAAERFATRNLSLSDADLARLRTELANANKVRTQAASAFGAFPPRKPMDEAAAAEAEAEGDAEGKDA